MLNPHSGSVENERDWWVFSWSCYAGPTGPQNWGLQSKHEMSGEETNHLDTDM